MNTPHKILYSHLVCQKKTGFSSIVKKALTADVHLKYIYRDKKNCIYCS